MKKQVGVIGLAVMGKNLALNIAENGFRTAVYNRSPIKTEELIKETQEEPFLDNVEGFYTISKFVESLEIPRKIIMMVKAGSAVDDTIQQLLPLLSEGDLLMDGGNSYYMDTIRRSRELEKAGILYLGAGISGGEEGARKGPAIMPGGKKEAYELMEPILTAISAKAEGEPCSNYIGENGAGHFVKMVHNGIEYADMQLISEAYHIMKKVIGLTARELQDVFSEWNKGELNSYLIEITADIFGKKDDRTENYLVDMILDVAGQKGTGKWTGQISLDLGVPTPTITTSVYERCLSAMKQERVNASRRLKGPKNKAEKSRDFVEAIRRALYASKICAYAQGFGLLRAASEQYDWKLRYGDIAKIFRGGCIIRAQFLNQISKAYEKNPSLINLLMEDYFMDAINEYQEDWREVVRTAISNGISAPAFSSSLAYYDSYRTSELPMNLLQAQRDYFGAHTYERIDAEGTYHTNW
ncbi:NADP-dependent phosphogluconate dehydrogenase [Parasporobacterium paucivorans]|uniref:6-phosphogluconate dehydrogenase, decarboxylating n=1 Tax=Parasporobacterium paucivorans DSM 15970 TaxID=1122934 RepID=A0A1M6ISW3_9FIRM|nr:NADP-dependent phosphogluconate dehydrogenase [Parasporobacterium paucivorans]SHJ37475.1 6-phosphogluconate dehydrogenase [Parasporobacterium paucivorans DSM 15970]